MTFVLHEAARDYPKNRLIKKTPSADCTLLCQKPFRSKERFPPNLKVHELISITNLHRNKHLHQSQQPPLVQQES